MTRILFVDNDYSIRRYCKQELETAGFEVVLAADGEEAVNIFDPQSIDLVILDEHMPRCSGMKAAAHLRTIACQVPIILFTADSDYVDYHAAPIDACIAKSENLTDLIVTIDELLIERCDRLLSGAAEWVKY